MKKILLPFLMLTVISCASRQDDEPPSFEYPDPVQLTEITASDRFDDDNLFGRPTRVLPLDDGRFIVGDTQTLTLYLFDEQFSPLASYGSEGQGPGEFQQFSDLILDGSTLTVFDARNQQVSEIDVENNVFQLVQEHEFGFVRHPDHPAARFWRFMPAEDGNQIVLYLDFNITSEESPKYTKLAAFPYNSSYQPGDENPVAVFDFSPEVEFENGILSIPHLRRGYFAALKNYMVYAESDEPVIHLYNQHGEIATDIPLPDTRIQMTRDQKREAFAEMYTNAPEPERLESAVLQYMPEYRSIIRSLVTDADSRIWTRIYRDDADEDWLLFEKDGETVASLFVPENLTFRNAVNNRVFAQRNSESGAEIVILDWTEE